MRHGKKQQSWFIILFLCIMVSINNADLWGQKFPGSGGGSTGSLSPAQPGRAGSAPSSSPGLMPASGFTAGGNPPQNSSSAVSAGNYVLEDGCPSATAKVGTVGNIHQ